MEEHRRFRHYMFALASFDMVLLSGLFIMCGDETFNDESDKPKAFNGDFWRAEVVDFEFSTSMFDFLLLSYIRGFTLIFMYWWKRIITGKVVLGTTVVSVTYCIIKYVMFRISESDKWLAPALLLASLLLPCLEAWLWVSKRPATVLNTGETAPLLPGNTPMMQTASMAVTSSSSRSRSGSRALPISINSGSLAQEEDIFETPPESAIHMPNDMSYGGAGAGAGVVPSIYPQLSIEIPSETPADPSDPAVIALEKVYNVTRQMCTSLDGWDYVLEQRGVKVYQRKSKGGANHLKGVAILPFAPHQIMAYSMILDERLNWNKAIKTHHIIRNITPTIRVTHTVFKAPSPVASREFIYVEGYRTEVDGSLLSGVVSIDVSVKC